MNALHVVFKNKVYLFLACVLFLGLLFPLLIISEYVFLEPYLVGHIPKGSEFGLVLIVIVSILASIVLPMNVYRIRILRKSKNKISSSVLGSIIGASAGACGCGPIGFAIFSSFGAIGGTTSAFLTNYEIPIRLAAVAILTLTYFTTVRSLKAECNIIKPS